MPNLALFRVKANAKYTCQECGSTELIQAHHEIPGDDSTLIVLCADCHSQRHPNMPKALFFNKNIQPYWHNKSAASLAKIWGVHPRTVIRIAKRLGIARGELSVNNQELIKNGILKLQLDRLRNEREVRIKERRRINDLKRINKSCHYCLQSGKTSIKQQGACPLLLLIYSLCNLSYQTNRTKKGGCY